jgi:hypothetical protein
MRSGDQPASAGEHTEPTLRELADLAEELGDPLDHGLVLLEMIRDDEVQNERYVFNIAAAVMALIEQADQRRKRLMEHLDRLAKSERLPEGNHGSQEQPEKPETLPSSR